MKRDFFCTAAVLLAASACMTGCKDDSEDDYLAVDPSDVACVFINEVCSSGTDWVELCNVSDEAVSLAGFRLQDNKGTEEEYIFPAGASIAAHGYLVLEKDAAFEFGISGYGDEIKLLDASYRPVDEVVVPALEDGQTYARTSNGGAQWTIVEGGTKGRDNTTAPDEQPEIEESNLGLFINEVFTNNQDEQVSAGWDDTKDFIELYNASDKDIDLSGFSLNDEDLDEDKKYVFPDGSMIPARSFFTVDAGVDDGSGASFGLGKKGDAVYLYDKEDNLVDALEDTGKFEDEEIYSIGRKTDGGPEFVVFTEVSKNASNNGRAEK